MKKFFILLTITLVVGAACQQATVTPSPTPEQSTLTIYTYDSLAAEGGLLPAIKDQFEQQYQVRLEIITFPDTGTMLQQLLAEQNQPSADIVLGLDNVNFAQTLTDNLFEPYRPQPASSIAQDLQFDSTFSITPFDYGYIGFVYDTTALQFSEPISLQDLATPQYADQIIIEQPGLSSPGTQLVLWAQAVVPTDQRGTFWDGLASNSLAVTPDWSTAYYTMFLNGEAPIVLSYLTSPAYHIDQEQTNRYAAIPIKEGYIRQIEGVAIIRSTDQLAIAQQFIDYLLTDNVQNMIPTTQWMFPVLGDPGSWPAAYNQIIVPTPEQVHTVSAVSIAESMPDWLRLWQEHFQP
ncbi:MAG: thiamine ABC transporter substrate-binding protein [Candidatus Kerfeldbacteria bacterium]|nr:thiamine ABC transporter substrate-binding protein [Candidatus Kerfeldbacteria bacterium]